MTDRTRFSKLERPSMWRRLAKAGWEAPTDPSIQGFITLDVTRTLDFIDQLREATGEKITMTHLVVKAIARAIAEYPLINGVIRWNGFFLRETIDVFVLAARDRDQLGRGGGLSGVKVTRADKRSILDTAQMLKARVADVVAHKDKELESTEKVLRMVPDTLLKPLMNLIDFLTYELDLDLRSIGIQHDPFGSAVVTNVGMLGLSDGFAPIFPPSRCPIVLAVGEVHDAPCAIGKKVEVRPHVTLGCTADHRFIDGLGASKMVRALRDALTDPFAYFGAELDVARGGKTPRHRKVPVTRAAKAAVAPREATPAPTEKAAKSIPKPAPKVTRKAPSKAAVRPARKAATKARPAKSSRLRR